MSLNPPATTPSPRPVSMAMLVVAMLLAAGVAVGATAAYYELRPAASASGPGHVGVTDDLGRRVTVPTDPSRVVVLGPSVMDSMYRLGLRSHVVGVDCYAGSGGLSDDYSPDQIQLWDLSPAMCVQSGPTFDLEQLLNLTPQLVLASTIVSVANVEAISQAHGIPVVILQPPSLSGVIVDEELLGTIFGVSGAASALDAQLTGELANATTIDANLSSFPTVLVTYSVDQNGYWTFGPTTFGQSLIELAGGASISANATLAYPELSGEQVLASDPEYLVYGTGFGQNESTYASAPFWSDLGAVKDGHAIGLNSNWLTEPDPSMILEGVPALLALLHPPSG
jgi:iron complex transport system substrate-binding protein